MSAAACASIVPSRQPALPSKPAETGGGACIRRKCTSTDERLGSALSWVEILLRGMSRARWPWAPSKPRECGEMPLPIRLPMLLGRGISRRDPVLCIPGAASATHDGLCTQAAQTPTRSLSPGSGGSGSGMLGPQARGEGRLAARNLQARSALALVQLVLPGWAVCTARRAGCVVLAGANAWSYVWLAVSGSRGCSTHAVLLQPCLLAPPCSR